MDVKASSTKAGGKPAGAIMGRKIGGIGAGKKAGDAWAGEKSAGAGKQAGSRWLPFVAVAVVAVAIIAAIILGMGKLPPSAPPSPSRAVNISSLDELCSYLKGSIADAGKCPGGTLPAAAPASAGKNKTCCYLPLAGNEVLTVNIIGPQAAPPEPYDPASSCDAGAGYRWCDAKLKCIDTAVENCTDAHGCTASTGIFWCEEKLKCIDPASENCTDIHGCIKSAGYTWCGIRQECMGALEWGNCTSAPRVLRDGADMAYGGATAQTLPNGTIIHTCNGAAGYVWCGVKGKCLRPFEEICDPTPKNATQKT